MGVPGRDCRRLCGEGRRSLWPACHQPLPVSVPSSGARPSPEVAGTHVRERPRCSLTKPSPSTESLGKGEAFVPRQPQLWEPSEGMGRGENARDG